MEFYTLYNGVKVPKIGYGTWQIKDGEPSAEAVKKAIELGYRHIDTAAVYQNESGVGQGIIDSKIKREDIFLTTKVWNSEQGYESTLNAFNQSLAKLKTDYIDLYLIHWPAVNLHNDYKQKNLETWRALETLYEQKKVRAIGVCNFFNHHLENIFENAKIKPMVNQIEINPGHPALAVVDFSQMHGLLVQGYTPLMKGRVFEIPELMSLAKKYQKTVAQIVLRWALQRQINILTKSVNPTRIKESLDVFDFTLSKEEIELINGLSHHGRSGVHPDDAKF